MRMTLMAAKSLNNVIGDGLEMPWKVKGEQLLFKAITYNSWLLVGRKTFESMGALPNRNYAIVTRNPEYKVPEKYEGHPNLLVFNNIPGAIEEMSKVADHLIVAGGGEIYRQTIDLVHFIHLSIIQEVVAGDIFFPPIPDDFVPCYNQMFQSNIDYSYNILKRRA
jgi:dihydrofolate reductase (trimethoprim resistance protein)